MISRVNGTGSVLVRNEKGKRVANPKPSCAYRPRRSKRSSTSAMVPVREAT
jgi:hypothetical protein